jgi:cell wall assembly regulator SMI1
MKSELKTEIDRLHSILKSNGLDFTTNVGVSADNLARVESEIGFTLDDDLKALWQFTNGSNHKNWFTVFSDEQTLCSFPSIEKAFEQWSMYLPYDDTVVEEFKLFPEDKQDERIQPTLVHRFWFPCAEFNCFSTNVQFDADPTEKGQYGQIIVYQHDPDAVYFVAENFLEFFQDSNDKLDAKLKEYFRQMQ